MISTKSLTSMRRVSPLKSPGCDQHPINPIISLSPPVPPSEAADLPSLDEICGPSSLDDTNDLPDTLDFFLGTMLGSKADYSRGMQCLFCDKAISQFSNQLWNELEALYLITRADPTLLNPRHRKAASFTVTIDFSAYIHPKPNTSFYFKQVSDYYQSIGAASCSPLKRFMNGNLLQTGSGYYGHVGVSIGHAALKYLFPFHYVDLDIFHPLDYDSIITHVLIPEVFTTLVEMDLNLPCEAAVHTVRASESFGIHEHPVSDDLNNPASSDFQHILRLIHSGVTGQGSEEQDQQWLPINSRLTLAEWLANQGYEKRPEGLVKIEDDEDGEFDVDPIYVVSPSKKRGTGSSLDPLRIDYDPVVDRKEVKRKADDVALPETPTRLRGISGAGTRALFPIPLDDNNDDDIF
ncbi:hypothetical protein V5O48_018315 [Marasmius crinis-equi]|uniref:Restriction of telomere capping protein 4 C-terminal domain-containing protein n=1 Tax=Marasmius crinis-equi TaxID=585013 RepID=A0ABR3ELQ7_9AGAR